MPISCAKNGIASRHLVEVQQSRSGEPVPNLARSTVRGRPATAARHGRRATRSSGEGRDDAQGVVIGTAPRAAVIKPTGSSFRRRTTELEHPDRRGGPSIGCHRLPPRPER
jgi:hypothetical protein